MRRTEVRFTERRESVRVRKRSIREAEERDGQRDRKTLLHCKTSTKWLKKGGLLCDTD